MELLPRLWTSYDRSMATGMYLADMAYLNAIGGRRNAGDRNIRLA